MICKKYKILNEIGKGSFGSIYRGVFRKNNELVEVAIKFDYSNTSLKHEATILNYMNQKNFFYGIPKIHWFGYSENPLLSQQSPPNHTPIPKYPCLILPLYKWTMKEYFFQELKEKPKSEYLNTINKMFLNMVHILCHIHSCKIIHRDIKLCNFMFDAITEKWVLIDYGISTTYIDAVTNEHILPSNEKKQLIGSPLFVSWNIHCGCEPTRRDDCISIFYIYLWFLFGGKLPWEGNGQYEWKQWEYLIKYISHIIQDYWTTGDRDGDGMAGKSNSDGSEGSDRSGGGDDTDADGYIFMKKIVKRGKHFYDLGFSRCPIYDF